MALRRVMEGGTVCPRRTRRQQHAVETSSSGKIKFLEALLYAFLRRRMDTKAEGMQYMD